MDKQGLRVLRLNLVEFIKSDPTTIRLNRSVKVETDNGGYRKGQPTPIPPQSFRLMPFKRRLTNSLVNTQDGDIPIPEFILVGRWNADIQRWDEFSHNGNDYLVSFIEMISDDRTKNDRVVAQVMGKAKGLAWQAASS